MRKNSAGKIASLAWALAGALLPVTGTEASHALKRFEFVEPHMGTLFQIVVYGPEANSARASAQTAFGRIAALDRILSDYDPASEVNQLCRQPVGRAVPVSADLFAVLERSQRLAEKSGGAFDATLGPIIQLWRETRRSGVLPAPEAREHAMQSVSFSRLRLDPLTRTVCLLVPGMRLDFGGIAKGYAAEAALATLAAQGFRHALIAASGDLALGEAPPGKRGWTVAIEPFGPGGAPPLTILASGVGISTSGDATQFVEIGGQRYSHIVDPQTGLGLTAQEAVTVVTSSATDADGLATACSVAGAERGRRLLGSWGAPVRVFVHHRGPAGPAAYETYGDIPDGLVSPR